MAIKKRPLTEAECAAAIAAFGDGAVSQPDEAQVSGSAPRTAPTATRPPAAEPTGDVPSTSLVRWADEELPRAIQQIAAAEDRSFHNTMLQLRRRGVDDCNGKR